MKTITKTDAYRIIYHISQAAEIFRRAEEESDDGEIVIPSELMETIDDELTELDGYVNHTNWEWD